MLLIKTHKDTLERVIEHCKHALDVQPMVSPGDIILIAQTKDSLASSEKPIRYRMECSRIYGDFEGESEEIWGKHWRYIIEGRNCRPLIRPFDISELQVTDHNYKQGGPFTYVAQEDVEFLYKGGYLETC